MNKPIFSIITPYYNGEKYIDETAKSVLSQTFKDFEWIIVDDGSSEEGKNKLKEIGSLDDRIKIFLNQGDEEKGKGPAQTRDFGISKSDEYSKYIVFLDADDLYNKTFLECSYWKHILKRVGHIQILLILVLKILTGESGIILYGS